MLRTLTRKLCPLMSLAVATIGCGKKITEAETKPARQTQNQLPPSTYILQLNGKQESSKTYTMPMGAQYEVPDRLRIKEGSPAGKKVDIAFNVDELDEDYWSFKCTYISSANKYEMILSHCLDEEGGSFHPENVTFSLQFGDLIQLRFTGPSAPDLVVEAIFSMRWI